LQDYAVIYGVTNKGGIAFCNFLASKGFNLILVDKEKEKMESCVKNIRENLTEAEFNKLEIIKVDIPVFDETNMQNLVRNIETKGRIKFFINTKNVRLAKKSQKKFDQISHKEVYQMIHENNENFVSVFNVFLKLMIKHGSSSFINLSNF
jgi:short-subunit dehydrogenase